MSKTDDQWKLPYFYYAQEIEIGPNGEKLGLLMVDSCFALCSEFNYGKIHGPERERDLETKHLKDYMCRTHLQLSKEKRPDAWAEKEGTRMYQFIMQTLEKWDADPSIVWRISVQHHPLFGKWFNDSDKLIFNEMEMLMDHKFDLYLNGHEHAASYAYFPYNRDEPEDEVGSWATVPMPEDETFVALDEIATE